MAFPLFELVPEQQEEVITKLDALEICRLKASSQHFQHLLTSPEFVTRYNAREDNGSGAYCFTHIQDVGDLGLGVVRGHRWDDGSVLRINLDALLLNIVVPGDMVTLLYCCRSHFLFSLAREGENMVLVVVNFTNHSTMVIHCPPPMQAAQFIDDQRNIQMTVFAAGAELHFRILHVVIDEALQAPRLSLYDSTLNGHGGWVMVQQAANAAPHEGLQLDVYNEDLMILPHGDQEVLFVTLQNQVPLFVSLHLDDLFAVGVNLPMTVFNVGFGWNFNMPKHFAPGGQGWAATIITHDHAGDGVSIIKDVSLFRFNPYGVTYLPWSSIEARFLDENEELVMQSVLCEATDHIVQVAVVVNHGFNSWSVKWFVYQIASGQWSVRDTPEMNATRLVSLASTPG